MKIAFDAKRVYQNSTGLGHYSRTLVSSLAEYFPQHQYYLCAPKLTNRFNSAHYPNITNITPNNFLSKKLTSLWRSNWVKKDLQKTGIELYHGLSHEIPVGIENTGIKTVVTIHDLIFERYPHQYNWIDVNIYRRKFKYACYHADTIIAISEQTKKDIIQFYKIPAEKITVCYQSCNPAFASVVSQYEKKVVKERYQLPDKYFLYVGSIIERKNLLNICRALNTLKGQVDIPLVVIGQGDQYEKQVKTYIRENGLQNKVIFLSETKASQTGAYKNSSDFPAIYQQALCMIYPSVFEGFGIPVLEALCSRLPVITSNVSSLPEAGGRAAYYIDPASADEIATAMMKIATNEKLVQEMKDKGWQHAQNFTPQKCAADVMEVYLRLQ